MWKSPPAKHVGSPWSARLYSSRGSRAAGRETLLARRHAGFDDVALGASKITTNSRNANLKTSPKDLSVRKNSDPGNCHVTKLDGCGGTSGSVAIRDTAVLFAKAEPKWWSAAATSKEKNPVTF